LGVKQGQVQFHTTDGEAPTPELLQRIQKRLDVLQTAMDGAARK
jgi:hypothetical protein